jgi:putative addiction module component (TIGR02574 family)
MRTHNSGMARPAVDILALSPAERLELIGELWDSLDATDVELTPEQCAELDRRLDALEIAGPVGAPWHEVEARIRARSP